MSKDGGPAFPRQTFDYYPTLNKTHAGLCEPGMSLRDYFAAAAMQGLIASNYDGAGDRIEEVPQYAYLIADAMLKARDQ